ncbi:PaaI family thioesterase [Phenylobacterium sp.]|uniref:PaaI family thioesterase n=1 Tax=Phenylobacterium sp. TaxID=1871053 RepID=UPI00273117E2|nr:PaaI family thioesterase [Phenylobacterium sp.]MDP2212721.1 PaaI family thioesterase [Phenylobacterium sp.]
MTWATERLEAIRRGEGALPPIVEQLRLGRLDAWGEGWVRKIWTPHASLDTADGSLFGGYVAALADQALAFAAMTVVPDDKHYRTVQLQVSFLRIGRNAPVDIHAQVIAATRQMIAVRASFVQAGDRLIAEASAQQILLPLPLAAGAPQPAG